MSESLKPEQFTFTDDEITQIDNLRLDQSAYSLDALVGTIEAMVERYVAAAKARVAAEALVIAETWEGEGMTPNEAWRFVTPVRALWHRYRTADQSGEQS
jgi:hypothetical protein